MTVLLVTANFIDMSYFLLSCMCFYTTSKACLHLKVAYKLFIGLVSLTHGTVLFLFWLTICISSAQIFILQCCHTMVLYHIDDLKP